jgi:hypothetical protein
MDQIDQRTNAKPLGEKAAMRVSTTEVLPREKLSYIQIGVGTLQQAGAVLTKFAKFVGPGTIISVAYIDPDNFQTDVSSGVSFEFKLLFMILLSNLIAIFLQVNSTPNLKPSLTNPLLMVELNRPYQPSSGRSLAWI